jgi:hypothetical protein
MSAMKGRRRFLNPVRHLISVGSILVDEVKNQDYRLISVGTSNLSEKKHSCYESLFQYVIFLCYLKYESNQGLFVPSLWN